MSSKGMYKGHAGVGKGACVDQCAYYGCNLFDVLENVNARVTNSKNTFSKSFLLNKEISSIISCDI